MLISNKKIPKGDGLEDHNLLQVHLNHFVALITASQLSPI